MGRIEIPDGIWATLQKDLGVPGMSIAIVRDQQVAYARGFGFADLEPGAAADETTPYPIASLTKPFTAVLLLGLVESGRLDLDDAMADLLRDSRFCFGPDACVQGYSALAQAISDMQRDPSSRYAPFWKNYQCETQRISVRHHLTHTSEGVPGEAFHYNGELFWLLTHVVEKVAGMRFDEALYQAVVRPLEMTRTIPCLRQDRHQAVMGSLAKPYRVNTMNEATRSRTLNRDVNASSGMISTVLDVAAFAIALDRDSLVSKESKAMMFTPTLSPSGRPLPYGMGWFVQDYRGTKIMWHYGWLPDAYSSLMVKIPRPDASLILLANSDRVSSAFSLADGDVLKSPFAAAFIDAVLGA